MRRLTARLRNLGRNVADRLALSEGAVGVGLVTFGMWRIADLGVACLVLGGFVLFGAWGRK